ncbi:serine-threonine protein kinase 19, partial [Elsinoe ampelina]
MSFSATGARRPLQSKPKQNPFLKRSSSSFSNHARTKPSAAEPVAKKIKTQHDSDDEALHHGGIITSLAQPGTPQDVVSLMNHIRSTMFDPIPERSSGMNSSRIAEVLNFRRDLAPIVSIAHIHALSASPTTTDREIAKLTQAGTIRRITIPGRGTGGSPIGHGLVLTSDWTSLIRSSLLPSDLQDAYISLLTLHPTSPTIPSSSLPPDSTRLLITHGFLTSTSALSLPLSAPISHTSAFSLGLSTPVANAGTTAPTGSLDAVGGIGAVHLRGGGTGGLPTSCPPTTSPSSSSSSSSPSASRSAECQGTLTFSLPNTASYLRLLTQTRAHLVSLICRSSPRHKEALSSLVRERWDGNVPGEEDAVGRAKRTRGEWSGVLPGRTKKWKGFCGVRFGWVLEEGVGSGVVEGFRTGGTGLGVR